MKSVLACISKVIFLMVAGNIVKRYSELPKTITLTLNHILQLGFCRSLISSSVRIFIFSFSQFKRPRCVGPLWGILSQCGAAGAPGMGGFP